MELFVYLEAKEQGRRLIAINEQNKLEPPPATEEEINNYIIKLIVDKHRGCDAVFRDLFAIPAAKHSPATFYVSGEGFENGEVSDNMDALFGLYETTHKDRATLIVKEAIAKHHARFGKSQHDNYLFLEVEREEMFRQLAIRDKEIADLKEQLDDCYNEEQMEEKLEEKEMLVLEELYCGGEFDEKYCEIINEGKSEVFRDMGNWLKHKKEELDEC